MQAGPLRDSLRRALRATVQDDGRVDHYYAPVAFACVDRLERAVRRPWVLGVQGPQGSGKTTLTRALARAFDDVGLRAATVSVDDFYLTYEAQRALAERHAGNPYLRYRGYPGTHDVPLGDRTLEALATLRPAEEARVPVYLKAAHDGRGDRAPADRWPRVTGPLDVLLFEGWLLGFSPVDPGPLDENLHAPNAYLADYAAWHRRLDAFLRLDVARLDTIVAWRVDAERARRAAGEMALSDADARDYIERFLPAYRTYVPGLRAHPPCPDVLSVALGTDRMPAGGRAHVI